MALYAFDGTWNTRKDNDVEYDNTNVCRFYEAYAATSGTHDIYEKGIGTRFEGIPVVHEVTAAVGGAFGAGELDRLLDAYRQLCINVAEKGDTAIDLVGFSRGAATCLDFCNLVEDWQIRDPKKLGPTEDLASYLHAPQVGSAPPFRFVGLFDVVGAFGLGAIAGDLPEFNLGHRLRLPKTRVNYCFHAMALDETRSSFNVIRVKGAHEVWFRGVHTDIGGSNRVRGLNDIALRWMFRKAIAAGLPIDPAVLDPLQIDYNIQPALNELLPIWRPLAKTDLLHYTVRTFANTRPLFVECPTEFPPDEAKAQPVGASGVAADAVPVATA
jgi:hypothetical protein